MADLSLSALAATASANTGAAKTANPAFGNGPGGQSFNDTLKQTTAKAAKPAAPEKPAEPAKPEQAPAATPADTPATSAQPPQGADKKSGSEDDDKASEKADAQSGEPVLALATTPDAAQAAALASQAASVAGKGDARSTQEARDEEPPLTLEKDALARDKSAPLDAALDGGKGEKAGAPHTDSNFARVLAQTPHGTPAQHGAELKPFGADPNANQAQTPMSRHEIATLVATRGWAEEVSQKVGWVANRDGGRAELILNPPQLGRIEVSIHLQGDQASASFVAANAITREALNDAMPRLREALAQAGINLGQANVGAGNQQQTSADARAHAGSGGSRDAAYGQPLHDLPGLHATSLVQRSGLGMIDLFA